MKIDTTYQFVDDDGVKITRLIKDDASPDYPTNQNQMLGMKRVPFDLRHVALAALDATEEKELDARLRLAKIKKCVRKGGVVDMPTHDWTKVKELANKSFSQSLIVIEQLDDLIEQAGSTPAGQEAP